MTRYEIEKAIGNKINSKTVFVLGGREYNKIVYGTVLQLINKSGTSEYINYHDVVGINKEHNKITFMEFENKVFLSYGSWTTNRENATKYNVGIAKALSTGLNSENNYEVEYVKY